MVSTMDSTMVSAVSPTGFVESVPQLSERVVVTGVDPFGLHEQLLLCHQTECEARLKFVMGLTAMYESESYLALGESSIVQYARKHFHLEKSTVYEYIEVGTALAHLPRCLAAFEAGEIQWSALRLIARVAKPGTEDEWLELAGKVSLQHLEAEVKDAAQKGRDRPRSDSHGLPNLWLRFCLDLSVEEHERMKLAFQRLAEEMAERLGTHWLSRKEVFLYLLEMVLDGAGFQAGAEGAGSGRPSHTILYHVCPGCRDARLVTAEGSTRVPIEVVERIEGEAERVELAPEEEVELEPLPEGEIDPPSSANLARKVVLRDGQTCANPHCGRQSNLHAHHIRWRSRGGRTAAFNEITVCKTCHSLIHAGLLEVSGNPLDGLRWTTALDRTPVRFERRQNRVAEVPIYVAARAGAAVAEPVRESAVRTPEAPAEGTRVESAVRTRGLDEAAPRPQIDYRGVAKALHRIGVGVRYAREAVAEAVEQLREEGSLTPSMEDVFKRALRLAP